MIVFEEPSKEAKLEKNKFVGFQRILFSEEFIQKEVRKTWSDVRILINQDELLESVEYYKGTNIPRMNKLKDLGFSIGYSDHIQGVESAKVTIEFGAKVIEKHFTIDNNLPGRDNKFAILPSDLSNLSLYLQLRNEMLINKGVDFQECESDSRTNYTGRFNG